MEASGLPRVHILKSLALASKPQVLENCPVLGSKTALFFGMLKVSGTPETFFGKRFFWRSPKNFSKYLSLESTCGGVLYPWPRMFFYVLGLGLEPCVLDSTADKYVKIFTLYIPISYCSLLRRIRNVLVRILYRRNVSSIKSVLVAWFGLCFTKYFTPGNVLSWTNLLGYHNLALPNYATSIRSVH